MQQHMAQVTITAAQGGHSGPVQVLLPFRQFLLSADWLGTIKLWDMATGQCVQTMQQAHKEPIMGVLQWEVSPLSPPVQFSCFPASISGPNRSRSRLSCSFLQKLVYGSGSSACVVAR